MKVQGSQSTSGPFRSNPDINLCRSRHDFHFMLPFLRSHGDILVVTRAIPCQKLSVRFTGRTEEAMNHNRMPSASDKAQIVFAGMRNPRPSIDGPLTIVVG